jgi:cobalt-zinc-cadmium efflux system outer membrane protein
MNPYAWPKIICFCAVSLLAASCARFHPQPITAAVTLADFESRRLDDEELKKYVLTHQAAQEWPPKEWDIKSLTLAAFYYSHDLDVARAQWGLAEAGRIKAGERPNPSVNALQGYNSTTPVAEITPWIPEIVLEIPLEVAGKRGYRISQARHLADAALLNIVSIAWDVRSRLRQSFLDLYAAQETESLLFRQQALQEENARIIELQLAAGGASPYEVTQSRIALDNSRLAALEASRQKAEVRVRLADIIGVPVQALDGLFLSFGEFEHIQMDIPSNEIRRQALLNRADILSLLSEYAASQAALQLEIARQYPDIRIGLGYQLDQTDSKWTLGLALDLPILNRNRGQIAEAEARRTETAARFLALQAKVIGALDIAVASCRSASVKSKAADELLSNLIKQEKTAKAKYELGEISKLELLGVELELASSALSRLDALVRAQESLGKLEDVLQSPLDLKEWVQETPRRASSQVKE